MNSFDFDKPSERRGTDSEKWRHYGPEILPMWVADMDFAAPPAVIAALHDRVEHGVFGYGGIHAELTETLCERLQRFYGWTVSPGEIVFLPGLVSGLNAVCRAVCPPETGVLVQTPVYPPFLGAPANHGLMLDVAELTAARSGDQLRYEIDFEAFSKAIQAHTRLFVLCNPHNPVGRCWTRAELTALAEICERRDLTICADEIHGDVLLGQSEHIPIATLGPETAQRCITLIAPSKTYNVPGLYCGFAIIQNPRLRARFRQAANGIVPHANVLGLTAALAAYRDGESWRRELLSYLTGNRDFMLDYLRRHLPMLHATWPEGTYLAWLDCHTGAGIGDPYDFFLRQAGVALNDGLTFGTGGAGFVRLNFGCPRATLAEGLTRMRKALESR